MRPFFLLAWLLLPVLAAAYHYGPGQEKLVLDESAALVEQADALAAQGEFAQAVERYNEALKLLPAERLDQQRQIRLQRAKAQMMASQLPLAHQDLQALVDELAADEQADPKLLAEARRALAHARYYMTWLLRLEGEPREVWEPEIEAARQTYRLLAEESQDAGEADLAQQHQQDLEAAIRLARLELTDLQALPLPSQ